MNFSLIGDKKLIAKLNALQKTEKNRAIKQGTRAGCKVVLAKAKSYVAVKTGATRAALKVRALPRSRKFFGTRVTIGAGNFKGKTFYASFVEFGKHVGKRMPKGLAKPRRFVKGKHRLQQATQDAAPQALRVAIQAIAKSVRETMSK